MRLPTVLLPAVLLAACSSAGMRAPATLPPMPVQMAVGQGLTLPDASTLRYVGTRDDSRCPPQVTCVWAGEVTVLFDHAPSMGPQSRLQAKLPKAPTFSAGAWQVTVEAVDRGTAPKATIRVDAR